MTQKYVWVGFNEWVCKKTVNFFFESISVFRANIFMCIILNEITMKIQYWIWMIMIYNNSVFIQFAQLVVVVAATSNNIQQHPLVHPSRGATKTKHRTAGVLLCFLPAFIFFNFFACWFRLSFLSRWEQKRDIFFRFFSSNKAWINFSNQYSCFKREANFFSSHVK